jgi:hypothetical protein
VNYEENLVNYEENLVNYEENLVNENYLFGAEIYRTMRKT